MSKLRGLAGDTLLYGVGTIVPRMMNFLLVWLHTRIFAPADYGAITQLYAFVGFLNVVYTFGMETAFFRFATKSGADPDKVFNLCQTVIVGISAVLTICFIIFSSPLASAAGVGAHANYIVWLALVMFIDASVAIPFAKLRLERRALKFTIGRFGNILILIALNVFFLYVVYKHYPSIGVGYVFAANLIANAFYLFFFSKTLLRWRPRIDRSVMSAMILYSYPIMITGLAGMTNEMFSRVTLDWWLPDNFYPGESAAYALGVFGACYKYAFFMGLVIQAFRFAAEPFFFSNASGENARPLFARVNHYFVVVCCIILLGISINLDIVKYFLGRPEYWEGLKVVPILLLGYLFLGVYYNFSVWFKLTDRTYFGTWITICGAVVTILLNYLLIPVAGYLGSSFATLGCYMLMAVLCYSFGQAYYPIPYRIGRGIGYVAVTTALVYLVGLVTIKNGLLSMTFHFLVVSGFVLGAYLIERRRILVKDGGGKDMFLQHD